VAKLIPVSLSPSTLTFGNQNVGSTSTAQTITLINEKNAAPLNIAGISSSGDFAESDTCGSSLAAGLQCTLSVTFIPTVPGSRGGSITLTDDASSTPQIVALSGTGIGPFVTLGAANISFGNQTVGTTATAQVVTLTNSGNAPLAISSIALSGANSSDFTQTNTCPGNSATLAANANCAISISLTPTAPGNRSADLTITDNAANTPQTVALSGTGIGPFVTLGAASTSFGNQALGTTATAQVVTLTNSGNAPLTITSIALSGANSGDFMETNTCPGSNATLAANANCAISITFTPTVPGNRSANVTITDNALGSPHIFSLSGTGTDYSLAAATGANCPVGGNCSTSASIAAGQTASYDLQVTPNGGFNRTVALTCTGAPRASICSISPASVPLNGSSSYAFVVTVSNTSNWSYSS
jgi:hypothetical protein